MSMFLVGSTHVYRGLLYLYGEELRREFGLEMSMVFADDLADARKRGGWWACTCVWACSLAELVRLAIPRGLASSWLLAPAASFLMCIFTLGPWVSALSALVSLLAVKIVTRSKSHRPLQIQIH
jgi:hypothetical protein